MQICFKILHGSYHANSLTVVFPTFLQDKQHDLTHDLSILYNYICYYAYITYLSILCTNVYEDNYLLDVLWNICNYHVFLSCKQSPTRHDLAA